MRTGQKHESVTVQTKGDHKTSNVVSTSKAVGDNQHFYRKVVHPAPLSSPVKTSVYNGSPQRVLKMVIEWLKVKVSPELREKFIQKDAEIWTALLASYPGFLGKEVWINPEAPDEVVLIIRWRSLEEWKAVPQERAEETEKQFTKEFGAKQQIIEEAQYQVRKFPQG